METAKKTKLYALDMEWSEQEGLVQPLEIGLLSMEEKTEPYFSLIAPSDEEKLHTRVFGFLREKKTSIMTGLKRGHMKQRRKGCHDRKDQEKYGKD